MPTEIARGLVGAVGRFESFGHIILGSISIVVPSHLLAVIVVIIFKILFIFFSSWSRQEGCRGARPGAVNRDGVCTGSIGVGQIAGDSLLGLAAKLGNGGSRRSCVVVSVVVSIIKAQIIEGVDTKIIGTRVDGVDGTQLIKDRESVPVSI
jgi:hypothetical protein